MHDPLDFLARAGIDPAAKLIAATNRIDLSMFPSQFYETFL